MKALVVAAVMCLAAPAAARAQVVEVIAEIQVHGNNATPDADVLALAGVKRGDSFGDTTVESVRGRLEKSGRFEAVDVRKRFASLADPSQITLVIVIDEYPASIVAILGAAPGEGARVVRRSWIGRTMFLPILDGEDGYGLTYGALVAYPDAVGKGSRLLFPLSWGGRKHAGAELAWTRKTGPFDHLEMGVALERRTNPAFDEDDGRRRLWARAERRVADVRFGATAAWERVSFGAVTEPWRSIGADVAWDTRVNPVFPRNAIYARAGWTHLAGTANRTINRTDVDVRGYVGLVGQAVLVARAERQGADRALPEYFKPLLGGWSSLRGYRAGAFVGDTRVNGSVEIRVPLSSPLSVAKLGLSVFADAGTSYDRPERLADARWHRGVGAGVWLSAAVVQFGVSVARGRAGDTRVNVGFGVAY